MTTTEIIEDFELQVDDMTELSTAAELKVLNRVRRKINRRLLEANRRSFSGVQSIVDGYVALPSDFYQVAYNRNTHDAATYGELPGVFIGSGSRMEIVPYGDRDQYYNSAAYGWIDPVNNRLYFGVQPTSAQTVKFDYYALPADLALGEIDWITQKFPDALVYGMAVEDTILQQSDKAKSYLAENLAQYQSEVAEIALWNARFLGI